MHTKTKINKLFHHLTKHRIFTELGIGSTEKEFLHFKSIFNLKPKEDTSVKLPRDQTKEYIPTDDSLNLTVKTLKNKDIKLQGYRLQPQGTPKGLVFVYHGMHDQIKNAGHLAEKIVENGFVVAGFDHRGHGRSEGVSGLVEGVDSHKNDCLEFYNKVAPQYPDIPKYAMGLSMGGFSTYLMTYEHPELFNGAIFFAPAIKMWHNDTDFKIAKFLGEKFPEIAILPNDIYGSNSYKHFAELLAEEKGNGKSWKVRFGTAYSLLSGMRYIEKTYADYKTPFLAIQGDKDKLVHPDGCKLLYEQSQIKDKQLIQMEDLWHDVWHEPQINDIMVDVVEWLNQRSQ